MIFTHAFIAGVCFLQFAVWSLGRERLLPWFRRFLRCLSTCASVAPMWPVERTIELEKVASGDRFTLVSCVCKQRLPCALGQPNKVSAAILSIKERLIHLAPRSLVGQIAVLVGGLFGCADCPIHWRRSHRAMLFNLHAYVAAAFDESLVSLWWVFGEPLSERVAGTWRTGRNHSAALRRK